MSTYLLVFALVTVAIWQAQSGLTGLSRRQRRTKRRFDGLGTAPDVELDLLRRRSRFGSSWLVRSGSRLLLQSGTRRTPASLALIAAALGLGLFLALPVPADAGLRLAAALVAGPLLVLAWLRRQRSRRMARFGEQLPDVLDIIVRSLRAGHPLAVSLSLVAREIPEPA